MPFTPKKLALLISSLCVLSPLVLAQTVAPAEQEAEKEEAANKGRVELAPTIVTGTQDKDAEGHDKVYQENVTSVYKGREELQRFQVSNPGDVFKGMNGVYSMDTRSSQSITPNIRGITGEGRTPLTIDGTEQSTNVWLHFFGSGNRSYVDPALFRSIEVEKGPSLSRGIKSGVGGAVNIRTIEASDIIPEGDSFGIEAKLESSGNTSKPKFDAGSYYGKDWRDIPGAERVNITDVSLPSPAPRTKDDGEIFNFEDHSEMLALAARNEFVDVLLARSERTKGNYYAGKRNADKYEGHDPFDKTSTDGYIPNLTKLYYPGNEVFNTASDTETTLFKNNWHLPNNQKIGLQFMRTDMTFGETTPGNSILMWGYREGAERTNPDYDWANARQFVFERPHSELRVDSYKLSYDIKPQDSDWLDLETSLWQTKTEGTRYQTGAWPYGINVDKAKWDELFIHDSMLAQYPEFAEYFIEPDHDGTILPIGRQWTSHDRTGLDFSNQLRLSDSLQLTLGGGYQQEKLDDRVQQSDRSSNGLLPDGAMLHTGTDRLGPRSGERKEYSAMMNLSWQATDWLTVTAGTRYLQYTGKDTGTAKLRQQQSEFYRASRRLTGVDLSYGVLLTDAELETRRLLYEREMQAFIPAEPFLVDWIHNGVVTPEIAALIAAREETKKFANGREGFTGLDGISYWRHKLIVPVKDGKMDSSQNPFANGELDPYEVVENAQGTGQPAAKVKPEYIYGDRVYETLASGKAWEMPEEQSGHALSPVLSATARLTPFGTAFVRYAQTTRFPSIQELTSSAIIDGAGTVGSLTIDGASKPERSTNWEVGYAHDLTQFFPSLGFADVRLSYYNTEIEDFIDRNLFLDTIQFDKKKTSGLELQSRFDSGRLFGNLGATYRLEQELCDKDYASSIDPFFNRIPNCMTGGFPGTYGGNSLQPPYSIDMGLGTRLFNQQLELGWRAVYHAAAQNEQLDDLLASQAGAGVTDRLARDMWFREGQDTFYWQSVLLHDLYANYQVNKQLAVNMGITNLTDEYYLDPMAKTLLPAPGRTVTAGLKVNF